MTSFVFSLTFNPVDREIMPENVCCRFTYKASQFKGFYWNFQYIFTFHYQKF